MVPACTDSKDGKHGYVGNHKGGLYCAACGTYFGPHLVGWMPRYSDMEAKYMADKSIRSIEEDGK